MNSTSRPPAVSPHRSAHRTDRQRRTSPLSAVTAALFGPPSAALRHPALVLAESLALAITLAACAAALCVIAPF